MNAAAAHNSATARAADVLHSAEAHQETVFEGAAKIVVLNGSRIVMHYRDGQWWNDRVSPL